MSGTHNILVISDLHLGEDLSPSATEECAHNLHLAESHLIDFLRKYTRRRADGRPWRLVINGDMVDFLAICAFPDRDPSLADAEHNHDERVHGLDRRVDATCAKLRAVAERHADFFRTLARFIAVGNRVEIICGNHDAEFFWPAVQDAFRDAVIDAWHDAAASRRPGAATAAELRARMQFHEWFYHEPGVVWIEHGHQYDECCSFEYNLHPMDARGSALVANVDTAAMRYVTNRIDEVSPHGAEEWSLGGYLRFAVGLGLGGAWRLATGYARFSRKLLAEWRASQCGRGRRARRTRHLAALRRLSERSSLTESTLHTLDAMQRPPVFTNLRRLLQVLMLDKLALNVIAAVIAVIAVIALPLLWALVVGGAAMVGAHALGPRLSRGRMVDASLPLQVIPSRLIEHVDAPMVVFGHTHLPVAQRLSEDGEAPRWYYNTGTWMPSGKPGVLHAFTHVVIRHTAHGVDASLCQWRDGASRAFTPGWTPDSAPVPVGAAAPVPPRVSVPVPVRVSTAASVPVPVRVSTAASVPVPVRVSPAASAPEPAAELPQAQAA